MYLIVINVYNHYVWIMSDREIAKIKVVDLNDFYKLAIDDFFHLKSFTMPKLYLKFSYFEIQILNYSNEVK